MTAGIAELESQATELAGEAFEAFCEDISGMFGVDMDCTAQEPAVETVKGLKKRFKKLVAVNSVRAKGALNGTFQLIFDQSGLFALSGVIVMLPKNRILEEIKRGTIKDVESMNDAIAETGNLLVGSWDRVFRKELEGHGHFKQTNTFVGEPWDNPAEKIGLVGDEEFVFVPHEITIDSFPAFKCGVIFPRAIFCAGSEPDTEEPEPEVEGKADAKTDQEQSPAEEAAEPVVEAESEKEAQEQQASAEKDDSGQTQTAAQGGDEESKPQEPVEEKTLLIEEDIKAATETGEAQAAELQEPAEEASDDSEDVAKEGSQVASEQESDNVVQEQVATPTQTSDRREQPISEAIRQMAQSPADLPGQFTGASLSMCAGDIMEQDVLWGSPDDSVEQTARRMQQANVGYVMIGTYGVLEGIISRSNIAEAISPYLRPAFARWRQPLDDATLQIKVKWIMSRPVRTVGPQNTLTTMIEDMRQFGGRCLPVVDHQGKVRGLVTALDIFKVLLGNNPNSLTAGRSPQAPPLIQLDAPVGKKL